MPTYAFIPSLVNQTSAIHSATCRCVEAARRKRNPVRTVESETAKQAALWFTEWCQLRDRGLPEPKVCKCAK
jgi:hypothetical protein